MLFILFLAPMFAQAQETAKGEHFIEVTGTAQQELEPNEISVSIRLREFEENRQKVSLEKIDKDFMAALKESGIDKKRLELADAGSKLDKLGKKEKDAFREKTYLVKLISAAELEKFLEKLESVKVDFVDIVKLHHTDLEKIKLDLRVKALQAAKSKAEILLKAIDSEVGKPIMVREVDFNPYQFEIGNIRLQNADGAWNAQNDASSETVIGFRKIKLQAQVTAQFEIK